MLTIYSRNVDEARALHEFDSPKDFICDWNSDDCQMGDNEILLVVLDEVVVYSSLGRKVDGYEDTVRTCDVIDWFRDELDDDAKRKRRTSNRVEKRLPDGAILVAEICDAPNDQGIRLIYKRLGETAECVCHAEFDPARQEGRELIIHGYTGIRI
jgi:hypothetical protein